MENLNFEKKNSIFEKFNEIMKENEKLEKCINLQKKNFEEKSLELKREINLLKKNDFVKNKIVDFEILFSESQNLKNSKKIFDKKIQSEKILKKNENFENFYEKKNFENFSEKKISKNLENILSKENSEKKKILFLVKMILLIL